MTYQFVHPYVIFLSQYLVWAVHDYEAEKIKFQMTKSYVAFALAKPMQDSQKTFFSIHKLTALLTFR